MGVNVLRFALVMVGVLFGCQAQAQIRQNSTSVPVPIIILPNSELDGESVTVSKDEPVLTTGAISPRAVRLTDDATVGVVGAGVDLKKGDILFGRYEDSVWTYCALSDLNAESRATRVVSDGLLTMGFSLLTEASRPQSVDCLHDADGDGRFETAWGAGDAMSDGAIIAISLREKSLSGTPGYERVDPREGLRMPVAIKWRYYSRSNEIAFTTFVTDKSVGTEMVSVPAEGDEPAEVDLGGVKLKLKSHDADAKTIDVEIVSGFPSRFVRLQATRVVTTRMVYY